MNTTKSICIKTTAKGHRRATYFSYPACRWLAMPLAEAELLIATGQAEAVKPEDQI